MRNGHIRVVDDSRQALKTILCLQFLKHREVVVSILDGRIKSRQHPDLEGRVQFNTVGEARRHGLDDGYASALIASNKANRRWNHLEHMLNTNFHTVKLRD